MTRVHHRAGGYTVGQAAAVLGWSVKVVNQYEKLGLLTSTRTPGGQRRFSPEEVEKLAQKVCPSCKERLSYSLLYKEWYCKFGHTQKSQES